MNFASRFKLAAFLASALMLNGIIASSELRAAPASRVEVDEELRAVLQEAVDDPASFSDRFEAEVWLLDMSGRLSRKMPQAADRIYFLRLLHFEATRARLPAEVVLALVDVESNFNRWAISEVGAQGYMQVMPFWLTEVGRPTDNLFRPEINLRMGCAILRYYLDKERGNLLKALARYNGSIGRRTYTDKVFKALRARWYRR